MSHHHDLNSCLGKKTNCDTIMSISTCHGSHHTHNIRQNKSQYDYVFNHIVQPELQ